MLENVVGLENISFILVFLEGILSFFSPCVVPLIPLYMSYLAGNTQSVALDGTLSYGRKKVMWHTLFFVLGISAAFFLLGLSFTTLGRFLGEYQGMLSRLGGILIIMLGLIQLGVFKINFLSREHRLPLALSGKKMSPMLALAMGFMFSFAWTPCVGPALSSVLILASGAKNALMGNLLVLVYALGFVLPFLGLGLFTTQVLSFLKDKQRFLQYTIKAGGVILIIIGLMTYTGVLNNLTSYLNEQPAEQAPAVTESPSIDFTLTDQFGNEHTLADYQGKVVFLNFWATWCGPCRMEMPHIQELYESYGLNEEEVVFLGVARPGGQEKDIAGIKAFLVENGYDFPVVFDESGAVFATYGINSFPTTFMIDKNGQPFGYVSGALSKEIMINIINQTLESTKSSSE